MRPNNKLANNKISKRHLEAYSKLNFEGPVNVFYRAFFMFKLNGFFLKDLPSSQT
jgi:hypothetical protein